MNQNVLTYELSNKHTSSARLYANRNDALNDWPKNAIIAELGVAFGDYSEKILKVTKPRLFDAYDLFMFHKSIIAMGRQTVTIFQGQTHRNYYEKRFAKYILEGKLRVFEGDGKKQMRNRDEQFYDVIYIDANHNYDNVKKDTEIATRCLKREGILVFNDYIMFDHKSNKQYGIVPVVNALCVLDGWRVRYFALHKEMFCDIALIRSY